jgi:hypothetical protein
MTVSLFKLFDTGAHLFALRSEDFRTFGCFANSLKDCCFACICSANYENTELRTAFADLAKAILAEGDWLLDDMGVQVDTF